MRFRFAFLLTVAAALLLHQLWFGRYWYEHGPAYRPVYGANFSCRHAAWLGLDCRETLTAVLDDLGVRHLRLSVYWDEIEPQDDRFDFSSIDWQLQEATARGARVVLTVGMKAQRYPEFYLPAWLRERAEFPEHPARLCPYSPAWDPLVREETLEMLRAVVERYAGEPTIEAWQVENEPLLQNWYKTDGWWIPPDVLAAEVAAVRAADPLGRPVVITDSTWYRFEDRWRTALAAGDVLGQAVYTKKHHYGPSWFYLRPYRLGPLTPD
ncbi:MAG TPA: beta-galactosidase, partial [Dehalococcoidia bacterium]